MTVPRWSVKSDYGRLYRHPSATDAQIKDVDAALEKGLLMPSVTNIIDSLDKPFLRTWYAKRTAEDAVKVNASHPGLMERKPQAAIAWLSKAAQRTMDEAASLGDKVHNAAEALSLGNDPGELDSVVASYIEGWHKFVEDFSPEFLHTEATCFGTIPDNDRKLAYAGTADFIAKIDGLVVVGDYKSGKSIHDSVAQQLSAIAHTKELLLPDDSLTSTPEAQGGIAVHLKPHGYEVIPVRLDGEPWEVFSNLRRLWDFKARASASYGPILLEEAISTRDQLSKSLGL